MMPYPLLSPRGEGSISVETEKRFAVRRFVFAAVTALVLCAVCVGGVGGG